MSADRLGIGFVGSGFNARFHIQSLTAVREIDVRGVYSPNEKNAALRDYDFSILSPDARVDVAELKRLGREASSGPLTMMPENADAVLTYADRWEWDFKDYLIELNLELHTARTHKKLADGRYYQPSLKTKTPAAVIQELLVPLFGKP